MFTNIQRRNGCTFKVYTLILTGSIWKERGSRIQWSRWIQGIGSEVFITFGYYKSHRFVYNIVSMQGSVGSQGLPGERGRLVRLTTFLYIIIQNRACAIGKLITTNKKL